MTHAERCESARHCRWVDQVVEDAPWVIDDAFLEKYQIDYVAHDEDPYKGIDVDDVYGLLKSRGMYNKTCPIGSDVTLMLIQGNSFQPDGLLVSRLRSCLSAWSLDIDTETGTPNWRRWVTQNSNLVRDHLSCANFAHILLHCIL